MTAPNMNPLLVKFYRRAIHQQARFIRREISKDQLMENLRAIAEREGAFSWVDWSPWTEGGYVLPWDRQDLTLGTSDHCAAEVGAP